MVGRNGITELEEYPRSLDGLDGRWLWRNSLEEGWKLDVGARIFPCVQLGGVDGDGVPLRFLRRIRVSGPEHLRVDAACDSSLNLFIGGPDVFQIDGLSVGVSADSIGIKIDIQGSCDRIGYHEGWAREVARLDLIVNSPFKVAVSRDDTTDDELAFVDSGFDIGIQWTGVPDAGGAAIANGIEPECCQVI